MKPLFSISAGVAALMLMNMGTAVARVKAPPLPRGSEKVVVYPGQNPTEIARDKNAHQRPKKDKKRDDRLAPQAARATMAPKAQ